MLGARGGLSVCQNRGIEGLVLKSIETRLSGGSRGGVGEESDRRAGGHGHKG